MSNHRMSRDLRPKSLENNKGKGSRPGSFFSDIKPEFEITELSFSNLNMASIECLVIMKNQLELILMTFQQ